MKTTRPKIIDDFIRFRKWKGIRQNAVARKSDISHETISRMERGLQNTKLTTLVKMCEAIGCEVKIVLK